MMGLVVASALPLFVWTAWQLRFRATRASAAVGLVTLVGYLAIIWYAFDFRAQFSELAKGEVPRPNVLPLVVALYLFMVVGMAAEYLYRFLDANPGDSKFDWRTFAKPFVVSPLVFVPLAASLQNAKVDLSHFDIPLLMLFLVAFENGFLWRGYFTRKLAPAADAGTAPDQTAKATA